ncbi:MAG TPA: methyltransferase domain-containing protein [Anaerolineae bacterium]|nr:methyltransferase domain-containing protein [Anaerolineae bacterium]HQI86937.1 methyltransferase domain-containing protein [Anaerolineae bacterium]
MPRDTFRQQLQELPAFRALLRAVEADFYADLPLPAPVLDLGCGDGHFASVAFSHQLDVGLDPWWGPLCEARARDVYRILTHADGARMPFPDAHFAAVVSNSVLEHIPDVEPVVHEVARVLQPDGIFYFCVPGPHFRQFLSVARALDALRLRGLAEAYRRLFDRISRHRYYNTPQEWTDRLARAGLTVERWWSYFSPAALAALEWGHPLGLPTLLAKKLTGRWLLVPTRWNLAPTAALLWRYYKEPLPDQGAYLFFICRKS